MKLAAAAAAIACTNAISGEPVKVSIEKERKGEKNTHQNYAY